VMAESQSLSFMQRLFWDKKETYCCSILRINRGGGDVGAFRGTLPHIASIDNRSATVLTCKCSFLCYTVNSRQNPQGSRVSASVQCWSA
jgi:hypothetical protein